MIQAIFRSVLILWLGWASSSSAQPNALEFQVQVDRQQIRVNETLELTLSIQNPEQFSVPNLAPLEQDFMVSAPRALRSESSESGWQMTLQPKRSGQLEIPSLTLGTTQSPPIAIEVLSLLEGAGTQNQTLAPVFMQATLDKPQVYLQEQAVLTLRVYHSIALYDDGKLSGLQLKDTLIEPLGSPHTYEKNMQGQRHGVIEMRYALFPQRSGAIAISGLSFTATTLDEKTGSTRPIQIFSPNLWLQVKPIPALYPQSQPWLPAKSLSLQEHWNISEGQTVHTGEALTRTLRLKAEGVSAAQLPIIQTQTPSGIRRYADQPLLNNQSAPQGVSSLREQREALIPLQTGSLVFPELRLAWWNTLKDQLEWASLPVRPLQVESNLLDNSANSTAQATLSSTASASPANVDEKTLLLWQLAAGFFACTTIVCLQLWRKARRQPAVIKSVTANGMTPRIVLEELRRSCQSNSPQSTRQILDLWARQQPETLAEMAARFIPLSEALDELNGALYSEASQHWQGERLWEAISQLPPKIQEGDEQNQSALPPLYPQ